MKTKVLFIGGVFAKENIPEIAEKAIGSIEYSANTFQERLIQGFYDNQIDITVVSAPFIGAYPMRSRQIFFRKFQEEQMQYNYVPFWNIWGIRNFSRAHAIKHRINDFVYEKTKSRKIILVYSAHEPFLEAAAWAKRKDPSIKICFAVPDLPQYMNLNNSRNMIYDALKKIDIFRMERCIRFVDSFVVLTEQMKEVLNVGNRPFLVVEGILGDESTEHVEQFLKSNNEKYIVYTGKLNEKFGVKNLVDEFRKNDYKDYRLILCGDGDCVSYIKEKQYEDSRIIYTGQITPAEAEQWQKRADVLVNPRTNDEEYTKYSFPSKTLEYLRTGNPVVAYLLDGMKKEYKDFIYVIPENSKNGIMETVKIALEENELHRCTRYQRFLNYASEKLNAGHIVEEIMKMCNQGDDR